MMARYRQPWYLTSRIDSEFDRLMNETFGQGHKFSPAADVTVQDQDVVITIDTPGVREDDISVTLDGRRLVVSGERTELNEGDKVLSRGIWRGKFTKTFTVREGIEPNDVSAELNNGVLTVRVANVAKNQPEPQKIEVTSPNSASTSQLESGEES